MTYDVFNLESQPIGLFSTFKSLKTCSKRLTHIKGVLELFMYLSLFVFSLDTCSAETPVRMPREPTFILMNKSFEGRHLRKTPRSPYTDRLYILLLVFLFLYMTV